MCKKPRFNLVHIVTQLTVLRYSQDYRVPRYPLHLPSGRGCFHFIFIIHSTFMSMTPIPTFVDEYSVQSLHELGRSSLSTPIMQQLHSTQHERVESSHFVLISNRACQCICSLFSSGNHIEIHQVYALLHPIIPVSVTKSGT